MKQSGSGQSDKFTVGLLLGELALIVGLLWGLSFEYRSNQYMQAWVQQNAWPLAFLLNGYFAAILAGVLIGSVWLYLQRVFSKRGARAE